MSFTSIFAQNPHQMLFTKTHPKNVHQKQFHALKIVRRSALRVVCSSWWFIVICDMYLTLPIRIERQNGAYQQKLVPPSQYWWQAQYDSSVPSNRSVDNIFLFGLLICFCFDFQFKNCSDHKICVESNAWKDARTKNRAIQLIAVASTAKLAIKKN